MGIEIVPFQVGFLPAAADLLARRHARDREATPLLPARFTDMRNALAAVREVWNKPHTSGAAAVRDGRLVGFLLGEARFNTLRGRHVWVQQAGHALDAAESPGLYADLYAGAGPVWLRMGAFDHYVLVPAEDAAAQEAWFSLSFGRETVYAVRSLTEALPEPVIVSGVIIRRATEADRDAMVDEMSPILRDHMAGPPIWAVALPEYDPTMREAFADMLTDSTTHVWLAELAGEAEAGRVVGYQTYIPASPADDKMTISISERTVLLEVAATRRDMRGRGIGRALTAAGLNEAAAAGYRMCVMDWRTTNIEAGRFWPKMGFQRAVYRLVRKVDPRIAWAIA